MKRRVILASLFCLVVSYESPDSSACSVNDVRANLYRLQLEIVEEEHETT